MNNSELVQRLRCHDPAAVHYLKDCILPSVWRYVYVRVKSDEHLAEDIVSESVLALIKATQADDKEEIKNPAAWLRSVASNKIVDHFRAAARVQHLIEQVQQNSVFDKNNDPAQQHELNERRSEIRETMDQLAEHQRLVLEWKYIEKLSTGEIADRMQTTVKSVESSLFRARRKLRERIMRVDRNDKSPPPSNGKTHANATSDVPSVEKLRKPLAHDAKPHEDHVNSEEDVQAAQTTRTTN